MDGAGDRLVADQVDHPGDFAPAAEMNEVAEIPAAVGAQDRLGSGMDSETLDELRRLGEGGGCEGGLVKQSFPP